jgi:hypothetical protein
MTLLDEFVELITKDWVDEDFEQTPLDDLHYHISEWLAEVGGDLGSKNLFLAQFEFEEYMGW